MKNETNKAKQKKEKIDEEKDILLMEFKTSVFIDDDVIENKNM